MLTNHSMSQFLSVLEVILSGQGFAWILARSWQPWEICLPCHMLCHAPPCPSMPCHASLQSRVPRNFQLEPFCSMVSFIKRTLCWMPGKSFGTLSKLRLLNTSNTHVNYVWNNKPFESFALGCTGLCLHSRTQNSWNTWKMQSCTVYSLKWHKDMIPMSHEFVDSSVDR